MDKSAQSVGCAARLEAELEALQSIWGRPDFEVSKVAAAVVLERLSDGLRCSAALPPQYPECATAPTVSVLEHPILARAAISGANTALASVCSEKSSAAGFGEVGEVLLELFQRALDEVDAAVERANEAVRVLEADVAKRRGAPCAIKLKRVFIWFHHIKSRMKKRWILEWSRELGCGGLCKPGFPGAMYMEGPAHAVDELVMRLKGLQWQAMIVRHEDSITVPVAAASAADAAAGAGGTAASLPDASAEAHLWMRLPKVVAALAGEAGDADGGDDSESDEEAAAKGHDAGAAAGAGSASRSAGAAGRGGAAAVAAGGGSLDRPCIRLLPESGLDVMARAMAAVSPAALETFKAAILRL